MIEVNQQRLAVGAPCVSHSSARLVISEQGAWCIDVARIVVVLAIVNSYADSPQPWIDARPIVGDIKSIRIDDKIELTAHGATWRIASLIPPSEPVDADARAVENLITALHQSTTLVPAGSSTPPRPYLSVTSTASPQPFSFEWDPTQHTLHRNLDPVLLGLSDSAAKILATDRSNFRNRTLWVEDENNIDQLTIVDGNRPLRMVHRGAVIGEWFSNTNSQEGPMADASNIASIAASLRVDAFVAGAKAGRDARSITLHVAAPPFANAAPSTHVISIGRDCIGTVDEQGVRFDATTCATLRR